MVTTLSTNLAAAVAVATIVVTVAARIIVDRRGVPADHVRVVGIVTVGVVVETTQLIGCVPRFVILSLV